jgi:hypothetical protein
MSNTIQTVEKNETLTLVIDTADGTHLEYSEKTEPRAVEVSDGKIFTTTEEAAFELASELRAWGVSEARAFGFAVVFWG